MTYWLVKAVIGPVLRFFYRVRVEGLDNVPASGPAILVSNHVSFSDSIFLPLVLHRRITFVAKAEYFEDPKTAWFFRAVGQIPIKREGGSASQRALDSAREVLEAGGLFGIYPEGTRSPDGRLYRGRTGIGWLALHSGVPVIPVAMIGTERILPPGHRFPRPGHIGIRIGEPMTFQAYRDAPAGARQRRAVTDEVVQAICKLSGQEYVPVYASVRKEELAAQTAARKSR